MDRIIDAIAKILVKLSLKRVLLFALLSGTCVLSYLTYTSQASITEYVFAKKEKPFTAIGDRSKLAALAFMKKYQSTAAYLTVLKLEHRKNTRTPVYRAFNDDELRDEIMKRLNGGSGALPMYIKGDESNNTQMISLVQGEQICDPFMAGGLSRVWPDLKNKFVASCRVPFPQGFGNIQGYIVVHFRGQPMRPYEWDAMRIDLLDLAHTIEKNEF